MKAEFNEKGTLVIKAENNTEVVALDSWLSNFMQGDKSSHLEVDTESFRNVVMAVGQSIGQWSSDPQ